MEKKLLFLFTELQPFRLSHFRQLLHDGYGVCVISFSHNSVDHFQILHTFSKHIEDVHVEF